MLLSPGREDHGYGDHTVAQTVRNPWKTVVPHDMRTRGMVEVYPKTEERHGRNDESYSSACR